MTELIKSIYIHICILRLSRASHVRMHMVLQYWQIDVPFFDLSLLRSCSIMHHELLSWVTRTIKISCTCTTLVKRKKNATKRILHGVKENAASHYMLPLQTQSRDLNSHLDLYLMLKPFVVKSCMPKNHRVFFCHIIGYVYS